MEQVLHRERSDATHGWRRTKAKRPVAEGIEIIQRPVNQGALTRNAQGTLNKINPDRKPAEFIIELVKDCGLRCPVTEFNR